MIHSRIRRALKPGAALQSSLARGLAAPATLLVLAGLSATAASAAPQSTAPGTKSSPRAADAQDNPINVGARFMRTRTESVLRNFQDPNGAALATLPAGTLVRVFRESNGRPVFSEVEVAGGFPVWVYGKYLQPSDVEDVMLVTGSRVNMRPLPNSTPAAMPLLTKLDAGQRVRFIERANKSVALGEDWVRIQSPSHAKAWLRSDALAPVTDARKASAKWLDSTAPLPATAPRRVAPASAPTARPRSTSTGQRAEGERNTRRSTAPTVAPAVLERLVAADRAFDAASALKAPSVDAWSDVVEAYRAVMNEAPAGSVTREKAEDRFEQARVQMEFVSLRDEFTVSKQRSDAEIRRIDRMLEARQKRKTARWGRFEERGWIESRRTGGEPRWYLVFGGETVAEVRCLSGRYDLDVFEGYEIGVIGREIAPVVRATATSLPEARVVDAQRIEVISGRGRTR